MECVLFSYIRKRLRNYNPDGSILKSLQPIRIIHRTTLFIRLHNPVSRVLSNSINNFAKSNPKVVSVFEICPSVLLFNNSASPLFTSFSIYVISKLARLSHFVVRAGWQLFCLGQWKLTLLIFSRALLAMFAQK